MTISLQDVVTQRGDDATSGGRVFLCMEFETALARHLEELKYLEGRAEGTLKRSRYIPRQFAAHANVKDLAEITSENVRAFFFYGRSSRNWSTHTVLQVRKTLTVFLRWCVKAGYLAENPVENIPKPRLEYRLRAKLKKDQAARLLELAYNYPRQTEFERRRNHAIIAVFVFAGLRRQELLNLRYADVDLRGRTIFVRQGKGNKDRLVPVCATLAETLERYERARLRHNRTCPEFFTSTVFNRALPDITLKRLVARLSRAAGFHFTAHQLRHTFATLLLEGGCDIYSIKEMMGHRDIRTTSIYLAASDEHLRGQITKHPLNEICGSTHHPKTAGLEVHPQVTAL